MSEHSEMPVDEALAEIDRIYDPWESPGVLAAEVRRLREVGFAYVDRVEKLEAEINEWRERTEVMWGADVANNVSKLARIASLIKADAAKPSHRQNTFMLMHDIIRTMESIP